MTVKSLSASALIVLLLGAHGATAQEPAGLQSLEAVRSAAERALRRQIDPQLSGVTLEAVALDARLRLAACGAALETFAQPPRGNQARALVRVSLQHGRPLVAERAGRNSPRARRVDPAPRRGAR